VDTILLSLLLGNSLMLIVLVALLIYVLRLEQRPPSQLGTSANGKTIPTGVTHITDEHERKVQDRIEREAM